MSSRKLSALEKMRERQDTARRKALEELFSQFPDNRAGRRAALRSIRRKGSPRGDAR